MAQTQSAENEKPPIYHYVSEGTVPRAMWADYLKIEAADTDAMKKGVADSTLIAFGNFAVLNHQENEPTHGTWFSATSLADLMKFLEGLRTAPNATAPPLVVPPTLPKNQHASFASRWPTANPVAELESS